MSLRFPETVKWTDIRKVTGDEVKEKCGTIDIVAGGFPCQPFSVAGKQKGDRDDRNLWPEMLRVVKEVRPAWVVGENVSGIIPIYLDTVLNDLEAEGYATRTFVFPAHALGASHRRERIWVVAYSRHNVRFDVQKPGNNGQAVTDDKERKKRSKQSSGPSSGERRYKDVADTGSAGCEKSTRRQQPGFREKKRTFSRSKSGGRITKAIWRDWWSVEPGVGRVVNGMPRRVDRLKALGNGQVVACTAFIGQQIMEFERLTKQQE